MIAEDVNLDEIDDRAVKDAVMDVAQRPGKNERQGDRGQAEAVAKLHHAISTTKAASSEKQISTERTR